MYDMNPNLKRIVDSHGPAKPSGMPMQSAGIKAQQAPQANAGTEVANMTKSNPEAVARIRAGIDAGLQSGEITEDELKQVTQMAQVVLQRPELYTQMRQVAIQRGLATPEEVPEAYDEGLVVTLAMIGQAMQADVQMKPQNAAPPAGIAPKGAPPAGPATGYGGTRMEDGAYIIPKEVVMRKGTDFFDKMVEPQQPSQPSTKGDSS